MARSRSIRFGADAANALERIVDTADDIEACGFLLGHRPSATVVAVRSAVNIYASSARFAIAATEFEAARAAAEHDGCSVLGIFHVHPDRAEPSAIDLHQAGLHGLIWLVLDASRAAAHWSRHAQCFVRDGAKFASLAIVLEPQNGKGARSGSTQIRRASTEKSRSLVQ